MALFSKRESESLSAYTRRLVVLGRYRLWLARIYGLHRMNREVVKVHGHDLTLPQRSKGITEELRLFGLHEPQATELYSERLKLGMHVLEVGTNLGYYLAVADSKIGNQGRIIGVEPDPDLFSIATANANKMASDVTVKNLAISNRNGKATFFRSNVSNWGSLHQHHDLDQADQLEVETRTIDSLIEAETGFRPGAVRMDIEGHEGAALAGAVKTLQNYKPLLFIELHLFLLEDAELGRIFDIFEQCEYRRFTVINRYYDVPWSWHAAREGSTHGLDLGELRLLALSESRPNVISIISDE